MSKHTVTIEWVLSEGIFTDNKYSREHIWRFDGGIEVPASASPQVVPLPMSVEAAVDPEEAFVAALSSCHMLWFLSIAAKRGFSIGRYTDNAAGAVGKNNAGRMAVTQVTLRPRAIFTGVNMPGEEELALMHHQAHEKCFIANSVITEIKIEPEVAG